MTAEAHTPPAGGISPAKRLQMNRLGLWLFLLSETFLFGGILAARFYLWGATRPHLDQILGLSVTAMLLVSSFFINRAEVAIKHDDRIEFLRSTGITILLGLLFLVGVVGLEWRTAPVNPATGGEFGIYGDVHVVVGDERGVDQGQDEEDGDRAVEQLGGVVVQHLQDQQGDEDDQAAAEEAFFLGGIRG